MALQAKVNLITQSIKCDAGGVAPCSFDIENASSETITVGLEPIGESKGWVKLAKAEQAELELPPKALQRVAVNVAAPADAQAKRYSFKLRLYDLRTPTIAVESAAVAIDVAVPAVPSAPPPPQRQTVAPPGKRNWLPIAASVGGVVLIGAIVGVILLLTNGTPVPDLVGKTRVEAEALLEIDGFAAPEVSDEVTAEQEAGRVVRQTPDAGADAPDDGVVKLVVAVAPAPPDPNACKPGFVWRKARPDDVVCVTADTAAQVIADNAAAPSRISPTDRAYGPNTCIGGFVWREAFDGDVVCVTPNLRSQAWADNADAPNRRIGTQ